MQFNDYRFRVWLSKWNEYPRCHGGNGRHGWDLYEITSEGVLTGVDCEGDSRCDFDDGEVFERCTGIMDKNGKFIFESDVVICKECFKPFYVVYKDGMLKAFNNYIGYIELKKENFDFSNFEVIGTIHDEQFKNMKGN